MKINKIFINFNNIEKIHKIRLNWNNIIYNNTILHHKINNKVQFPIQIV